MMELTWNRQMSVGNGSLDSEHKALLDMVNDIERAIKHRDAAALSQSFKRFEDSVRTHFRNEANIAHAIKFPFEQHMLEHQYVLNELQTMRTELTTNEGRLSESASEHYYGFLSGWSTMHIDEDDMKMKALLETYPYDFKPPDSRG